MTRFSSVYHMKGASWVFAAYLAINLLPSVSCAIAVWFLRAPISFLAVTLIDLVALAAAFGLLMVGITVLTNPTLNAKDIVHKFVHRTLPAGLWLAGLYSAQQLMSVFLPIGNPIVELISTLVMFTLYALCATVIVGRILIISAADAMPPAFTPILVAHKKAVCMGCFAVFGASIVPEMLAFILMLIPADLSLLSSLLSLLCISFCAWLCIMPVLSFGIRAVESLNLTTQAELLPSPPFKTASLFVSALCVALCVALAGATLYAAWPVDKPYQIIEGINVYVDAGDEAFAQGDLSAAAMLYDSALAQVWAWQGALGDKAKLSEALALSTFDETALLLSKLSSGDPIRELKMGMNQVGISLDVWLQALLTEVNHDNNEDAGEVVQALIQRCWFQKTFVSPSELSETEIATLREMLSVIEPMLSRRQLLHVYFVRAKNNGGSREALDAANRMANTHPDDIYMQYYAIEIALSSAEGTLSGTVVDNYAKLLSPLLEELSAEQVLPHKFFIASAFSRSKQYAKALAFLETMQPDVSNTELDTMMIYLWQNNNESAKALAAAEKVLAREPNNLDMLLFCGIGRLKTDPSSALDCGLKLAEAVLQSSNPAKEDLALSLFVQYFTGYNDAPYRDYYAYKNYYGALDAKQQQRVEENTLLYSYVMGNRAVTHDEAISALDDLISDRDDLPHAYYLRGAHKAKMKNWEGALDDLWAAAKLDGSSPYVWLELGFAYEALDDLPKSLDAFERAMDRINEHGIDGYYASNGLSSHIEAYIYNAKHTLKEMMETEEGQ